MSISPLLSGRLPDSLIAGRFQRTLESQQRALVHLQDEVSSGQKFFVPSEDPTAAIKTVMFQKLLERKTQMQQNVQTDRSLLSASESALATVGDALNQANALLLAGAGNTYSSTEKETMATEVRSLMRQVVSVGNTQFRGRYLFAGGQSQEAPFEFVGDNVVSYGGDRQSIDSYLDLDLLVANNVDGQTAFNAFTEPVGTDIDPALTLDTRTADLLGGLGVQLGPVVVTVDNGTPDSQTVDLSAAETLNDIKTLLEDAFSGGPVTLTVDVDPATRSGLRLTPSAGTVAVADISGSVVAADLGIAGAAASQINGGELDPRLTLQTQLADLNAGTGIGALAGNGLLITNGPNSEVVDISTATTIEDLLNLLNQADLDLDARINESDNGLAVSSRLSGTRFSIGENNGANATLLGIRTLNGETLLADLNLGQGVPVDDGINLDIIRRDASSLSIDLSGTKTVQDVLDAINAVDPGNLVASLASVGNGISLLDNSGAGPLVVEDNNVSVALGLVGEESGSNPAVPLTGQDPNPSEAQGVLGVLWALQNALQTGDDQELERLSPLLDAEIQRFSLVRGEIGSRLQLIDTVEQRLLDEELAVQESLSEEFDTDLTEVLTDLVSRQQTLEATLQIAAQSLQLSLLSYL